MNRQWIQVLGVIVLSALCGCSAGGDDTGPEGDPGTSVRGEDPVERSPAPSPLEGPYESRFDPEATYAVADLPLDRGSYPRLDLTGLDPGQQNGVVGRLKTEMCTCGCLGDTIDECLVNDPQCETARILARQVIQEERGTG